MLYLEADLNISESWSEQDCGVGEKMEGGKVWVAKL
jgi:hypothetical protein